MVRIDVAIYPDRAASIRAGLDPDTTSIAVDLDAITQEQRDLLADHSGEPVTVATPTVEDLFDALRAVAAEEQATLTEILDAHRAVLQERRAKTWQEPLPSGEVTYDVVKPDWPAAGRAIPGRDTWSPVMAKHHRKVHQIIHGSEATEWMRELDALNADSRARARRTQRDAEEARQREHEQRIARLRQWAMRNGSERVRLLIEEEMTAWIDVAEDEYFTLHTPDGFTPLTDDYYARPLLAPEADDLHALRDTRLIAAADDALGEPDLAWIGKNTRRDQLSGRSAVRLAVSGPHDVQRLVWRAVVEGSSNRAADVAAGVGDPEEPDQWPDVDEMPVPTVAEAIDDFRGLIDSFEDMRTDQMTDLFYAHAYNQLTESGRQLLEALEADAAAD
jgi:hypothetical protein